MRNTILAFFILIIGNQNKPLEKIINVFKMNTAKENIYQFKVKDIEGNVFDFKSLKGKKIMIVNTASECGLTPQYSQLQELYEKYKEKSFIIIAFPSNSFKQEQADTETIHSFCKKNYGVTFPIMEKISVGGNDIHPLYQFLTQKSKNGLEDNSVKWNFQKYLIDKDGYLEKVISPQILPNDKVIIDWIKS